MNDLKILSISVLTLIGACSCSHQTSHQRTLSSMPVMNAPTAGATMGYAKQALALTNQARLRNGLRPLRHHSQLDLAARRHSASMAKHAYVGHHEPQGPDSILKRAKKAGYKPSRVAENVFGPSLAGTIIDHDALGPEDAVASWLRSPGHRKNIMNPLLEDVGFGYVNGYWTQVLAVPRREIVIAERPPKPRPTGPVKKPAPEPFNWMNL